MKKLHLGEKPCDAKMIRADVIDDDVWQTIIDMANGRPSVLKKQQVKDYSNDLIQLYQGEEQLIKKREKIRSAFRKNLLTEDEFEEDLKLISKELEQIKSKQQILLGITEAAPVIHKATPSEIFNATTFEDKRDLLLKWQLSVFALKTGKDISDFNMVVERLPIISD